MQSESDRSPSPIWARLLLAAALLVLVVQLVPIWGYDLGKAMDVRYWSRSSWIIANTIVILILVAVRFGPSTMRDWREQRRDSARQREKCDLANYAKERRESSKRLDESRKRTTF